MKVVRIQICLSILALLTASGCARGSPAAAAHTPIASQTPSSSGADEDRPAIDWTRPLPFGNTVATASDAKSAGLPFTTVLPSELGQPKLVDVQPPGPNVTARDTGLVAEFADSMGNPFGLWEFPAYMDSATWDAYKKQAVQMNGQPGVGGVAELVTLQGGKIDALLATWPDGSVTMKWIVGGVQFEIQGTTLDRGTALKVADAVAGATPSGTLIIDPAAAKT